MRRKGSVSIWDAAWLGVMAPTALLQADIRQY